MTLQLSVKLFQVHAANKNRAAENVFLLSPLCWCLYSQIWELNQPNSCFLIPFPAALLCRLDLSV